MLCVGNFCRCCSRRCRRMRSSGSSGRSSGWRSRRCGYHWARLLRPRRASGERQQRNISRTLDRHAQPPLVPRAHPGHAPGQNLAAFLHKLRQNVRALVVDEVHLLHAKLADFLLAKILAFPTARSAWTRRARTAFTPRAAMAATAVASATVPAAVATTVTASAIPPRRCARRCCLFLFLCHTRHPFT